MPVFLSDNRGLYAAAACKVNEKITFCAVGAENGKAVKAYGYGRGLLRANATTP